MIRSHKQLLAHSKLCVTDTSQITNIENKYLKNRLAIKLHYKLFGYFTILSNEAMSVTAITSQ